MARADVGLVLNGSMGSGTSYITSAGHAAIYLSRVCAASPVEVRMCAPGEMGSVLSNYENFGETQPFEWNVVPAEVFLYGVDRPEYRSLFATRELRAALQSKYRQETLAPICPIGKCSDDADANWRDMVAATFVRSVYIFEVSTTEDQDEALVQWLNSRPNVNHYHAVTNNCADFAAYVLNFYFHGSVAGTRLNDFGLTSPKGVARTLSRMARHNGLSLHVARFAQVPSDIRLSDDPREQTENIFHTKKLLLPIAWFEPHEIAIFPVLYWMTGRMSLGHAVRDNPEGEDLAALHGSTDPRAGSSAEEVRAGMKKDMEVELQAAQKNGDIGNAGMLNDVFTRLETSPLRTDAQGRGWILVNGEPLSLAADASAAPAKIAGYYYTLQLARLKDIVNTPERSSEDTADLKQDWSRLQRSRTEAHPAASAPAGNTTVALVRAGS